MKNHTIQKLIYELISKLFVFPIYKFVFKGHLIGRDNIPQTDSFIMVSNHGSLIDPPLLGHAIGRNISFMAKAELFKIPFLGFIIKACGAYPVKRGIADKNTLKQHVKNYQMIIVLEFLLMALVRKMVELISQNKVQHY